MTMFDEDNAIAFIRAQIGNEISSLYDDDEILNVIDIIWDFYESNGMLEIDFSEDDEEAADVDLDRLMSTVRRTLAKDKRAKIATEHIEPIVNAELAYEDSLEDE